MALPEPLDLTTPEYSDDSLYAVVLAGGHGERFWPLSRKARPKHHLALFSERTLLSATLDRLAGFVPPERTLVLTGVDQADAVQRLLPELPPENLVVEPLRRDTGAAMALAAGLLARRNPDATAIVLPADHHIPSLESFQYTLRRAVAAARLHSTIVTIAIPPDWPCPGFGYLELGKAHAAPLSARPVLRFHEKPSLEVATEYLRRGNFLWNAGMFVWPVNVLKQALDDTAPELARFFEALKLTADLEGFLAEHFAAVPKISFDYAVMEKLSGALAVDADFSWDDLGGWPAAGKYLPKDVENNASNAPLRTLDSRDNIVFSSDSTQHVALLGISDTIVVNTGDALLVCAKERAEHIKHLLASIPEQLH
jgi:mannose-1-phosphate guanylyltransferase